MKTNCIVLLGIGHTNAEVLERWAKSPIPNCRLVCLSKFPFATYSGMLPGTLANQFSTDQMQIALSPLCQLAGAELILDEVTGLDTDRNAIQFANRSPLAFDVLSIGIGSVPIGGDQFSSANMVPIKPMQTFITRLDEHLAQWAPTSKPVRRDGRDSPVIAVVGGGVAGVEVACCVRARLLERFPQRKPCVRIVTGGQEIAGGMTDRSIVKLRRELSRQSIEVVTGFRVIDVQDRCLVDADGHVQPADVAIWATGADAPPLLRKLNLPTDDNGFLATDTTLRTTAGKPIFVVGDSGTIVSHPSAKAGVYAVRQAPILWHNLNAIVNGQPLIEFIPQKDFLKILNTGQGKALLQYRQFSFHARWCWKIKAWIDRGFINRYQT
ncbi:FAD-dependent oxidoreductase [Rubripirellula reticaptiva]|uniref:NADH dehydrogenase-like protein YjlD n=1 Tax=Rubripirellula reticaptiva TaxID=2528013 RepID=A0A5C6EF96_9BACT|nr:FAD-dependent oxidoreductase [Rubripirellula reticaptiva]TWU47134.1 NADH dehydrogenase-like protein YjlD [Rubripirellula reticaptiva]